MLIKEDSIMRRLPGDDRKRTLFLDGIRYSLQMSEIAYDALRQSAIDLSSRFLLPNFKLGDAGASMMLCAWSIIDSVNRIRCILNQLPGLKKHEPYLRIFLDKTGVMEEMRNYVQHQTTEVEEYIKHDSTIWGVLGWVYKQDPSNTKVFSFVLIPGTIFEAKEHPFVNPSGRKTGLPVGLITLSVNEKVVCLSAVLDELQNLTSELEARVKSWFEGKPAAGSDVLVVAELEFSGKGMGVHIAAGDKLGVGVKKGRP